MKVKRRKIIPIVFLFLVLIILSPCSRALAEPLDSRWKWYYTTEDGMFHYDFYYDNKTIEYNAKEKVAKVRELFIPRPGDQSKNLSVTAISFNNKSYNILQYVTYNKNGEPAQGPLAETSAWTAVPPDTQIEALANRIAAELRIKPLYKGGSDRWKWLRSANNYNLYIAKDTLIYNPEKAEYTIWAKKVYANNSESKLLYSSSLSNMTIWRPKSNQHRTPQRPIPESDEEYIYNAIKDEAKHLK